MAYYYTQHSFLNYLNPNYNYVPPQWSRPCTPPPAPTPSQSPPTSTPVTVTEVNEEKSKGADDSVINSKKRRYESSSGNIVDSKKRRYESSSEESEETEGWCDSWVRLKKCEDGTGKEVHDCEKLTSESEIDGKRNESVEDEDEDDDDDEDDDEDEGDDEDDDGDDDKDDNNEASWDEEAMADPVVADLPADNPLGGLQDDMAGGENGQENGCSRDSSFRSENMSEREGGSSGLRHLKLDSEDNQVVDCTVDSLFESETAKATPEAPQYTDLKAWRNQGNSSSTESSSESRNRKKIENLPSVGHHQQQRPTHRFVYPPNHSCCTDSVFESDTSYWNASRDHSLEAEIVWAYDLPDVPQTPDEIPEQPTSYYELKDHVGQLVEIDEDDFARSFNRNRQECEKERIYWQTQLEEQGLVNWQRRKVHVVYIQERQEKREAKLAKRMSRSPSHEGKRLQKLKLRVRKEGKRMRKSIEEKGKEAWEEEHCDPEMKEAVKEEAKKFKLYGWAMPT